MLKGVEAIKIAQDAAGEMAGTQPYLPPTKDMACWFIPHAWILLAIQAAYTKGQQDMVQATGLKVATLDPRGTHAEKYFTDEGIERIVKASQGGIGGPAS